MPHPLVATGAVVAVSVAVATAIALYESPELRRYADDVRRRITLALHQIGDEINPAHREPMFNRPEDADGFLQSRGLAPNGDSGVEADEETRRRQREELLYWNSIRLEKQEREAKEKGEQQIQEKPTAARGRSFDDFLRQDDGGERGAFVYNTGADVRSRNEGLRHRAEGGRSFVYANPFADEHSIDAQDMDADVRASQNIAPAQDEMSDIYSATTRDFEDAPEARDTAVTLVDVDSPPASVSQSSATLERELDQDEFATAGQEDREDAYASIQAWAQNSSSNFYSPLPITPVAPVSEPELISDGQLTPTDSISIIGAGENVDNDAPSSRAGDYDVMSESDGMATPASWSDIGSVISESDAPIPVRG